MSQRPDAPPRRRPRAPKKVPPAKKVPRAVREVEILREAGAVFASEGYHAASMEEIAERAGVSKPLVYSYFGSKEGLYFAYIEQSGGELLSALAEVGGRGDHSPEQRLRAGTLAFFSFVEQRREGWGVLFGELAAGGATFRREVLDIRRRIVDTTAALLDEVARGADAREVDALAHAFVGAGESLANWWLENPDETKEAMADRLMDATWDGLRTALSGRR